MLNKAMERKLRNKEAIDVSGCSQAILGKSRHVHYFMPSYTEGMDYCDAKTERWIWSIGRRLVDGQIIASTTVDLYGNPEFYECLWLR